jgi:hypothetical protein
LGAELIYIQLGFALAKKSNYSLDGIITIQSKFKPSQAGRNSYTHHATKGA